MLPLFVLHLKTPTKYVNGGLLESSATEPNAQESDKTKQHTIPCGHCLDMSLTSYRIGKPRNPEKRRKIDKLLFFACFSRIFPIFWAYFSPLLKNFWVFLFCSWSTRCQALPRNSTENPPDSAPTAVHEAGSPLLFGMLVF